MPRWDNEELYSPQPNPKACEGCGNMVNHPETGYCTAYTVTKPNTVYFDGKPCPNRKEKGDGNEKRTIS